MSTTTNGKERIASCYHSPNASVESFHYFLHELSQYNAQSINKPHIVAEDFNGASTAWGSKRTTPKGRVLLEWAAQEQLSKVNEGGVPTFNVRSRCLYIDMTLVSQPGLELVKGWQVLDTSESLSDHNYVYLKAKPKGTEATPLDYLQRSWRYRKMNKNVLRLTILRAVPD